MTEVKWTPGPLTVRVSAEWPYYIETVNAAGEVVFSDRMPSWSSAMRSHDDLWNGVGFSEADREYAIAENRRAVADATIRAAAPAMAEAGAALQEARRAHKLDPSAENWSKVHATSIAFDAALSAARGD